MEHILLTLARIVLRGMESCGVMENANGEIINAKPMNMDFLVIVVNMTQIVGTHVRLQVVITMTTYMTIDYYY